MSVDSTDELEQMLRKKFTDFASYSIMANKSQLSEPKTVDDCNSALNWLVADTVAALQSLIEDARVRAELYGRLHENIENFQSGRLSAAQYSERHGELTDRIAQLSTTKGEKE